MTRYLYLHDRHSFEEEIRPALTTCWRQRRFTPARPLCQALLPRVRDYAQRFHTGAIPSLIEHLAATKGSPGLPFDRRLWKELVGEMLLYPAVDLPEFQSCEEALCCLLDPGGTHAEDSGLAGLSPIQQAHRGSRELTFGPTVYRPGWAGYNDPRDILRLYAYLEAVDPEQWKAEDLASLPDLEAEEREEELALTREWFPALRDLYRRCREQDQVIVFENVY
jgi:hypothetical protein